MRDTSTVRRTVVMDEFQELSRREMQDVTGGWTMGLVRAYASGALSYPEPGSWKPEPEEKIEPDRTASTGGHTEQDSF